MELKLDENGDMYYTLTKREEEEKLLYGDIFEQDKLMAAAMSAIDFKKGWTKTKCKECGSLLNNYSGEDECYSEECDRPSEYNIDEDGRMHDEDYYNL